MSWLSPDRFNDEEAFSTRFGALTSASSDLRNEFSALLRPHVLRRTKDDVLKMLPARHEVLGESWFGRLIDAPPLLTLANTPLKVPVPLAAAQAGENHRCKALPEAFFITVLCHRDLQVDSNKEL